MKRTMITQHSTQSPTFVLSDCEEEIDCEEDNIDFIHSTTLAPKTTTTSSSSTFSFFFLSALFTLIIGLPKKNVIEEIDVLDRIPGPMPHLVTKVELYILGGKSIFFMYFHNVFQLSLKIIIQENRKLVRLLLICSTDFIHRHHLQPQIL